MLKYFFSAFKNYKVLYRKGVYEMNILGSFI